MPLKHYIGSIAKIGEHSAIMDKKIVSEASFYEKLNEKMEEISKNKPKRLEQLKVDVLEALNTTNVSINDTWFDIKGKR